MTKSIDINEVKALIEELNTRPNVTLGSEPLLNLLWQDVQNSTGQNGYAEDSNECLLLNLQAIKHNFGHNDVLNNTQVIEFIDFFLDKDINVARQTFHVIDTTFKELFRINNGSMPTDTALAIMYGIQDGIKLFTE